MRVVWVVEREILTNCRGSVRNAHQKRKKILREWEDWNPQSCFTELGVSSEVVGYGVYRPFLLLIFASM